jgi:hypothetical protein
MRSISQSFAALVFSAPLALAACGVGTSQSTGTHHAIVPPAEDAGPDAAPEADGGCGDVTSPGPECTDCSGNPIGPVCVDGVWQCPLFGCPAGCGGSAYVTCPSSPGPCSPTWAAQCVNNAWTCVEEFPGCDPTDASPIEPDAEYFPDGGPPDDAPFADVTSPPEPFSCGNLGCDPASSYCQISTGGPVSEDGGNTGFYCIPLPTSCPAGGQASCACIQADQGIGCGCVEAAGDVTVTCEIP